MPRFSIRDVLWLTVVAALAMAWWIDQDRIRRQEQALAQEREAFRLEAQHLQALPLRHAEAVLEVTMAELAALLDMNRRNPGAIPTSELRRMERKLDAARLDVEKARTKESFRLANTSATIPAGK